MTQKPIAVIGCGNFLMSDEGVGVHATFRLSKENWPDNVELIDAGTPSLSLLHMIEGRELVVIIDSADMGKSPGTVLTFSPDKIETNDGPISGLHAADLSQVLQLTNTLKSPPKKIVIVGIQPKVVAMGMGLSDEVKSSLDEVVGAIRQLIDKYR